MGKLLLVGNLVTAKVGGALQAAHGADGGQPCVVGGRVHVPPGHLAAGAQRARPAGDLGRGQDECRAVEGVPGEKLRNQRWYDFFKTGDKMLH